MPLQEVQYCRMPRRTSHGLNHDKLLYSYLMANRLIYIHAIIKQYKFVWLRNVQMTAINSTHAHVATGGRYGAAPPALAEGLKLCGVYYKGFVTDLEGTLQKHRVDTSSTFSIRKSRKTVAGQHHANSEKVNRVQVAS